MERVSLDLASKQVHQALVVVVAVGDPKWLTELTLCVHEMSGAMEAPH